MPWKASWECWAMFGIESWIVDCGQFTDTRALSHSSVFNALARTGKARSKTLLQWFLEDSK